jgi:CO dehydrogenase/acetyl-CoA synthase delta subunit
MSEEIRIKLDELADLQMEQAGIQLRKQIDIDQIITPEVKAKLAEIDAKYLGESSDLQTKIAELDGYIRKAVLDLGTSIKGSRLHAVWTKGRVAWDTRALDGYATAHPEIAPFRKEGAPSVSIRPAK